MPTAKALARARKDQREDKSASTQVGEFVREEIDHMGEGGHSARSVKQAIAMGLAEAREAGIKVPAKKGAATKKAAGATVTSRAAGAKRAARNRAMRARER
jgi:hypothetical protein